MSPYPFVVIAAVLGALVVASASRAEDAPAPAAATGGTIEVSCIAADALQPTLGRMGYEHVHLKPVLIDQDQDAWLVVEDADGHRPSLLILGRAEAHQACLVAVGAGQQS